MLMILIIGLTGPRRVFVGIADRIAGHRGSVGFEPFSWLPSSMYFFALSHAPPPAVIDNATNKPVTIAPSINAPSVTNGGRTTDPFNDEVDQYGR